MDASNTKRARHDDDVSSSIQNINSLPSSNQSHLDLIISSLLSSPDLSPSLYSPPSISRSFDRAFEKALASTSGDVSVQYRLVDRTIEIASLLLESTKRYLRKRASVENSNAWSFPQELTIKMFSMLDKKSLVKAMVCCTMFHKCAMDPLCYSHIELKDKSIDDGVVCTMIHRAGKDLRSLKLGPVARPTGSDPTLTLVTGPFLSPLSYNHGFLGSCLRSLRLYNIRPMDLSSLSDVLSVCSNLTDLRIVGLYSPFMNIFKTLAVKCRLIEHLCLETYHLLGTIDTKKGALLLEFVTNSPKLISLTLICFRITDEMARNLVESSRKLKYLNLSRSPTIKGGFLRDLGHSCKDSPLKTLVLRNCPRLQEKEVLELCKSLLKGNFKSMRHIDVSNNRGLVSECGERSYKPNFPLEKLKEERADVTFVVDFSRTRSEKLYRICDEEELRLIEMNEDPDSDSDSDSDTDEDGTSEDDSDED